MCIKTLVGHVMCLKRLITVPFERSEPFRLLRMMGVSVPSLHIESTNSVSVPSLHIESTNSKMSVCPSFVSVLSLYFFYFLSSNPDRIN